jgi:AraC-like DNA-binding protein/quercetin dioxygenase-like cupin family protein
MKTVHNPQLKENERHARGYFPANYYMMVVKNLEQILPTHWHDEWEFYFVVSGSAVFHVNDEVIPMQAGEMAFDPSGSVHCAYAVDRGPCSYNALVFHTNRLAAPEYDVVFQRYIAPMLERKVDMPIKLSPEVPWQAEAISNVYRAYDLLQRQPAAYELRIKACIFTVFADIYAHCAPNNSIVSSESLNYRAERMRSIYDYIHNNCSGRLTVQTLSKVVNMSPGYLCRFFKDMTGRTITEYINHYRVSQAALLIESTDKKLLEVALDAGFNNLSYFVNQFKRYMGATPSEFKRAQMEHYPKHSAAGDNVI